MPRLNLQYMWIDAHDIIHFSLVNLQSRNADPSNVFAYTHNMHVLDRDHISRSLTSAGSFWTSFTSKRSSTWSCSTQILNETNTSVVYIQSCAECRVDSVPIMRSSGIERKTRSTITNASKAVSDFVLGCNYIVGQRHTANSRGSALLWRAEEVQGR